MITDQELIIYDAHGCPPFNSNNSLSVLERYKNASTTFLSLNVGFGEMTENEILQIIENIQLYVEEHKNSYMFISKPEDIYLCKKENKLGIAFDLEGTDWINNDLHKIEKLYTLGVRQMLLVYNKSCKAGAGYDDKKNGLTAYGKSIVREMNKVGMIVDCSHTACKTTFDIMETSLEPVVFSHSNPDALCKHDRNITDDQIKACAETGGVIGISGIGIFLGDNNTSTERLAEHIDYIVQLVGIEHVGIGLDYVFDHDEVKAIVKKTPQLYPEKQGYHDVNLTEPEQIPQLILPLQKKGYSNNDINAIMGGNFLRVANRVWKS